MEAIGVLQIGRISRASAQILREEISKFFQVNSFIVIEIYVQRKDSRGLPTYVSPAYRLD